MTKGEAMIFTCLFNRLGWLHTEIVEKQGESAATDEMTTILNALDKYLAERLEAAK